MLHTRSASRPSWQKWSVFIGGVGAVAAATYKKPDTTLPENVQQDVILAMRSEIHADTLRIVKNLNSEKYRRSDGEDANQFDVRTLCCFFLGKT